LVICRDFAELLDHPRRVGELRLPQQMIEQHHRLASTEETSRMTGVARCRSTRGRAAN